MKAKFDDLDFNLAERVKTTDLRQNFEQLNDILEVKFRQVEDTKEACRNLIAYQKYYHPIQTQQMISDSLMKLKAGR